MAKRRGRKRGGKKCRMKLVTVYKKVCGTGIVRKRRRGRRRKAIFFDPYTM